MRVKCYGVYLVRVEAKPGSGIRKVMGFDALAIQCKSAPFVDYSFERDGAGFMRSSVDFRRRLVEVQWFGLCCCYS